ncbi:hypothetical protein [Halobaculum sp. P14]|uniref:hypothetical protein n=1 Tax=Halobaculum sp. P14 TaxID=3421638 RepID=UPI003EB9697E
MAGLDSKIEIEGGLRLGERRKRRSVFISQLKLVFYEEGSVVHEMPILTEDQDRLAVSNIATCRMSATTHFTITKKGAGVSSAAADRCEIRAPPQHVTVKTRTDDAPCKLK